MTGLRSPAIIPSCPAFTIFRGLSPILSFDEREKSRMRSANMKERELNQLQQQEKNKSSAKPHSIRKKKKSRKIQVTQCFFCKRLALLYLLLLNHITLQGEWKKGMSKKTTLSKFSMMHRETETKKERKSSRDCDE